MPQGVENVYFMRQGQGARLYMCSQVLPDTFYQVTYIAVDLRGRFQVADGGKYETQVGILPAEFVGKQVVEAPAVNQVTQ